MSGFWQFEFPANILGLIALTDHQGTTLEQNPHGQ